MEANRILSSKNIDRTRILLLAETENMHKKEKRTYESKFGQKSLQKRDKSDKKRLKFWKAEVDFKGSNNCDDDFIMSWGSQTTSVSPKQSNETNFKRIGKKNPKMTRSYSFHFIKELPNQDLWSPDKANKWIVWLRLGKQVFNERWVKHFKSFSSERTTNSEFAQNKYQTITCNMWDDPFEPKHVQKEPCLSDKAEAAFKYLRNLNTLSKIHSQGTNTRYV